MISQSLSVEHKLNFSLACIFRYGYDIHDRYWAPYNKLGWTDLSTLLSIDNSRSNYQPPSVVMNTAVTPVNGNDPLEFSWDSEYATSEYYIYMYFAEVVKLQPNQSRLLIINMQNI
jgi:hypothetical protein